MEKLSSRKQEKKELSRTYQPKALTRGQYKVISDQRSKSLCQITTSKTKAIGFLCNIPNPVLITNNHSLNEAQINTGEEIKLTFKDKNENETYKTIKIDDKRTIFTVGKVNKEDIDITIIELNLDEDNLNNQEFIEIDKELMISDVKVAYEKKDIYMFQYKKEGGISTLTGVINEIKKEGESYTLLHTCDADKGSSGSPIILYNHKVIGIHRGFDSKEKFNLATLLQYSIKEFLKKIEEKKLVNVRKSDINNKIIFKNSSDKNRNIAINNEKNENIINDGNDNNNITMIYSLDKEKDGIRILGKDFVKNNKRNCKVIINKREYKLCDYINYDKYGINKKRIY